MDEMNAIEIRNVSKRFVLKRYTAYGGSAKSGTKQVITDLSLDVAKGEVLGLVGRNGSGKSTLLKLIAGILSPDEGTLETCGKVASILELGMGFDQEATGRDNIRAKCALYGFKERETEDLMDSMIAFSELGEQIDHPLRTYSSGMVAKLAFAVLIHVRCDVMVIDEVLSVGDARFNMKSRSIINRLRREGKTVVIASHNTGSLEAVCDRVVWLEAGSVKDSGDPATVCYRFLADAEDSPDVVRFLAESGDAVAQHRLGVMLRDGISMQADREESESWLRRASEQGLPEAMVDLGDMLMDKGMGQEALALYGRAAEDGSVDGTIRLIGRTEEEDLLMERMHERLRELSSQGNVRATKVLADALSNGTGCRADKKAAAELYEYCAERGNANACFPLGIIHRDGLGIPKDPAGAIKWLELALERGNTKAALELANMYRRGIGVKKDMDACIKWYTEAARRGDRKAMSELGVIYRDGLGVGKDPEKSTYWLKMYSEQNVMSAMVSLGDIIKQGTVGEERAECLDWYTAAAEKGNVIAMYDAAMALRDTTLPQADPGKAAGWLKEAAERGNNVACFEYAMTLLEGKGVPPDADEAFKYMKLAADMGNSHAILHVGIMFLEGTGTPRNPEMAKVYISRSAESGNKDARKLLGSMERRRPASGAPALVPIVRRQYALVQRKLRLPPEDGLGPGGVGYQGRGIPGAAGGRHEARRLPDDALAQRDHLPDAVSAHCAQVYGAGGAAGHEVVQSQEVRSDDVADVYVVADARAVGGVVVVSEEAELCPLHYGAYYAGDEVRLGLVPLPCPPGAVRPHDVEVPEADRVQSVRAGVLVDRPLHCELREPVRVDRLRGRVLADRNHLGFAVHGGRRGEHEIRHTVPPDRLQQVHRPCDVVQAVLLGVRDRFPDLGDGGEMDDDVEASRRQGLFDVVRVAKIPFDEGQVPEQPRQ